LWTKFAFFKFPPCTVRTKPNFRHSLYKVQLAVLRLGR
jgi:hypothetical protein